VGHRVRGVWRISGWLAAASCAAALAGCNTNNPVLGGVAGIDKPGTSIKVNNPNPSKWVGKMAAPGPRGEATSIWACRPLACAGAAAVAVRRQQSPTRHPDRIALEKAAKLLPTQAKAQDLVAEAASEGHERVSSLSSGVTEVRGYPAVVAETKRTSNGKVSYVLNGAVFIGNALLKIWSSSTTRDEAKRNFNEFADAVQIHDLEAPAPGSAPVATQSAIAGEPSER
jgi:hypothetical protein